MSTIGGTASANGPSSGTEQAKEKAQEKAQQAKGQAASRVKDQVDQRSTQAGQQVSSTASDIRSVADQLREQGKEQPAKLAEQAAQRAESIGDYLQRADGDAILGDLEDLGRRQPWAVIAGGLALGFAASRFLKASSSRRYETRSAGYSSPTTTRGLTSGAPTSRTGLGADDIIDPPGTGTGVPPVSGTGQPPHAGTVVSDPSAAAGDIPIRREDYTR
jgi:gas vesicle protein